MRSRQFDRLVIVAGGYAGADSCRAQALAWRISAGSKPLFFVLHNLAVVPNWYTRALEYVLDWVLGRCVDRFVTVSRAAANALHKRPFLGSAQKTTVIHNGIDIHRLESGAVLPEKVRQELGISPEGRIILMLGTYERRKGHAFLLRVFDRVAAIVPQAHLLMCGYGRADEVAFVEGLVTEHRFRERIHLCGFRNDVGVLFRQAAVLAVPSQAYESFGLMCVEAMAMRVPVVCTNVGGLAEVVVDGEGGFCVASDDEEGFAKHLLRFLKDETVRAEQGEKGFRRYKQYFTAERMVNEYAAIIRTNH